jgi:ketosteroid isomerase-like protein
VGTTTGGEMASKTMERTLVGLETTYWQALKEKDVETALELTADPCVIVGAQGVGSVTKSMYQRMMQDATWNIVDFKIGDDVNVEMLGRNVAIVAYSVHEDLIVDGEPLSIDAADSSTWARRDGRWQCVLHTESLLGDPFGRSR